MIDRLQIKQRSKTRTQQQGQKKRTQKEERKSNYYKNNRIKQKQKQNKNKNKNKQQQQTTTKNNNINMIEKHNTTNMIKHAPELDLAGDAPTHVITSRHRLFVRLRVQVWARAQQQHSRQIASRARQQMMIHPRERLF